MLLPVPIQVRHLGEELPAAFELTLEMLLLVVNPVMLFEGVEKREGLSTDATSEHSFT